MKPYLFKIRIIILFTTIISILLFSKYFIPDSKEKFNSTLELYWFIPDGFRADPHLFNIYNWANKGLLPNIKWMMDHGAYGYSIPEFPGHTATNMATLTTGTSPLQHGIYDGNLRSQGQELRSIQQTGYSSTSKRVSPIWFNLEELGKFVSLISIPGSTPPELRKGITLKGRFGNWGVDLPGIIFSSQKEPNQSNIKDRIFIQKPHKWKYETLVTTDENIEINFKIGSRTLYGLLSKSKNKDKVINSSIFSFDKKTFVVKVNGNEWSEWINIDNYQISQATQENIKIKIKLKILSYDINNIRIRIIFDQLNIFSIQPLNLANDIEDKIGPMVDYPDNNPLQLINDETEKICFLEEAEMSLIWHKKIAAYMFGVPNNQVVMQNIYTPNQLLTSKWWLPYLDPKSSRYNDIDDGNRKKIFDETLKIYKGIDAILGEAIKSAGPNSTIVLSSDHGAIPVNQDVLINNQLHKMNLLKYMVNNKNNEFEINWKETKAIFLQTNHIYINPNSLNGPYFRAHGKEYEDLRRTIKDTLILLKDSNGSPIFSEILNWEEAEKLRLPKESVGDLILVNTAGFITSEKMTANGELLINSKLGGYKQGVIPKNTEGMLTPFLIVGPKVKSNFKIENFINHADQYPTIMKSTNNPFPTLRTGRILHEIFKN